MPKGFTVPLMDVLAGDIGQRSIDGEWHALLARPDVPPLPPEPVLVARRSVPSLLIRLLTRSAGAQAPHLTSPHHLTEA
jgi:hypothetical protein